MHTTKTLLMLLMLLAVNITDSYAMQITWDKSYFMSQLGSTSKQSLGDATVTFTDADQDPREVNFIYNNMRLDYITSRDRGSVSTPQADIFNTSCYAGGANNVHGISLLANPSGIVNSNSMVFGISTTYNAIGFDLWHLSQAPSTNSFLAFGSGMASSALDFSSPGWNYSTMQWELKPLFLGLIFDDPSDVKACGFILQTDDMGTNILFISDDVYVQGQDTTPTPLPAAVWLLGTGLAGLAGLKKKFMA